MRMEVQSVNIYQNKIKSGSLYGVFRNHKEAQKTIDLILQRGYERDEIEVFPEDMGSLIPDPTPNHFPKGNEVMKESLKGLRNGAIIGLIASLVVVGIYMVVDGEFEQASLLFGIHSLVVIITIFGAVLGFFINPHLPKPVSRFFSSSAKVDKVTIYFEAHNMVDAVYFSEKGKLKIAQ
jgi:hypothetical protein